MSQPEPLEAIHAKAAELRSHHAEFVQKLGTWDALLAQQAASHSEEASAATRPDAPLDLDAIQARHTAATGGDWRYEAYAGLGEHGVLGAANIPIGRLDFGDGTQADADRDFVLNAHRDVAALLARVRQLEAERALYVGVEPTIAEEKAELSRRLDAVDAVVAQWNEHCVGTQTRFLLDDVRAAANGETKTQPTT